MRLSKVLTIAFVLVASVSMINCANQNKKISGLKTVYFDLDKAYVRSDMVPVMDNNVAVLKKKRLGGRAGDKSTRYWGSKLRNIVVEGHCDERGSNEYNVALGHRRAEVTKNYLVTNGINPANVRTTSFGEDRPVCRDSNESCWWKNRRAEFLRD